MISLKKTLAATATAAVGLSLFASAALADNSTNPTTRDATGFCVSNHARNFTNPPESTVGTERRQNRGEIAEQNRQIRTEGTALNTLCTSSQNPS